MENIATPGTSTRIIGPRPCQNEMKFSALRRSCEGDTKIIRGSGRGREKERGSMGGIGEAICGIERERKGRRRRQGRKEKEI